MEKVKVSKEVAEAIEFLKEDDWSFASVMRVLTGGGFCRVDEAVKLNTISIETVAQAYLNGYEVEKTPEQKLAEIYRYYRCEAYTTDMTAYADGIARAVSTLGITIKGVNA